MELIISTLTLSCLAFTKYYIKDSISRFCLNCFLIYWGVSLLITCFEPLGLFPISPRTHFILLVGMLGFFSGFCWYQHIGCNNLPQRVEPEPYVQQANNLIKSPIFLCFYVFSSLFLFKYARISLIMAALNGGTIEYDERLDLVFQGSAFAKLFMDYIINPLSFITYTLLIISFVNKMTRRLLFYIFSIIFIIGFIIITGSKASFIILLMSLFIGYVCIRATLKSINVPKKVWCICFPVVLLAFIGMAYQKAYRETGEYQLTTASVSESVNDMAKTFFVYSVIPIKLFDYALDNGYYDKFGTLNFGKGTFAGTDYIICRLSRHVLGHEPWSAQEVVSYLQDNRISVGIPSEQGYNYCYTASFYNYLDFGIIGVFFFPFIFGWIFRYFIIKFIKYRNLPDLILIVLGFYMMLMSLFNNFFIKTWVLIFCLLMVVWSIYCKKEIRISVGYKKLFINGL